MDTTKTDQKEKIVERVLFGTAVATLLGYLGLAYAILRKERHGMPSPSPRERNAP